MNRQAWQWDTQRLPVPVRVVRWGHFGTPVLLFPTAGGDCEEAERFGLVRALAPLIDAGRIKVYAIDGVAGRTWLAGTHPQDDCAQVQNLFEACVAEEIVPLIRADCNSPGIEVVAAGAAIGAFQAVACLCRHPELFRLAIAMSGTFDLSNYFDGDPTEAFRRSSPLHYLPGLAADREPLRRLCTRFVLLASGDGDYEDSGESLHLARVLDSRGIPNRFEAWGPAYPHGWATWREMLPKYLAAAG
jgi:esterase/lipase superfamily enzyme